MDNAIGDAMIELDRMALLLKPRPAFLAWVNQVSEEKTTLKALRENCTILLVPLLDNDKELQHYIQGTCHSLLLQELASWCEDEHLWPEDKSVHTFNQFFEVEVHSFVYDGVVSEYEHLEAVTLQ